MASAAMRCAAQVAATHRGGLLTQGSILTLTSYPGRISGAARQMGARKSTRPAPPPPPPNIPPLQDQGIYPRSREGDVSRSARLPEPCRTDPAKAGLEPLAQPRADALQVALRLGVAVAINPPAGSSLRLPTSSPATVENAELENAGGKPVIACGPATRTGRPNSAAMNSANPVNWLVPP